MEINRKRVSGSSRKRYIKAAPQPATGIKRTLRGASSQSVSASAESPAPEKIYTVVLHSRGGETVHVKDRTSARILEQADKAASFQGY